MIPGYIDKDEVRRRLSIPYACQVLGIPLDHNGRGMCPVHERDGRQHSPSLRLFSYDDGTQMWACDPCGIAEDVFGLIMRVEGIGFTEALERAAAMLESAPEQGTVTDVLVAPTDKSVSDWAATLAEAQARAASSPGTLAHNVGYVKAHELQLAAQWDEYLRTTWGWGLDAEGGVLMPHWNEAGELVGCKVRRGSARSALEPSRFGDALYGAWSGRVFKDVILCEGETDAAYARWAIQAVGLQADVFALPRGAGSRIMPGWLTFLSQRKGTVFLAFDPDQAGVQATRRWIDALVQANFEDVRICCLPLKKDLRAAKPDMRTLLENARRPLPAPASLAEERGGYVRYDDKGIGRIVTYWTVEPVAQLSGGDEPGFDVLLHSRGTVTPAVLKLADLASIQSLYRWASKFGEVFTGSDSDRKVLIDFIKARAAITPEIFQSDKVGMVDPPAEYSFAGRSVVYPTGDGAGQLPWRYAASAVTADVSDRILLPSDGGPADWHWLTDFLALNHTSVTHPLLAWLVAAIRRPEVRDFPILFIGGSSGVGKSTLAKLACRLLGSSMECNLGGNTPFILIRTLAASTSLPVFIDEWTQLSRQDTRQALQGWMPMLYAGELAERGQADLTATGYRLTAPTIIAGEDTFALDREIHRIIALSPSRENQDAAALERIMGKPLERLGEVMHALAVQLRDQESALPPFPTSSPTRLEHNRAVLEVGWATLLQFLEELTAFGEDVPHLPNAPDLSRITVQLDSEENVYETALIEASALRENGGIPVVWNDPNGEGVWVRFQALVGLITRQRLDIELPGRSRAMRQYFEEQHGGELKESRVIPPGSTSTVRAHLIPGMTLHEATPPTSTIAALINS